MTGNGSVAPSGALNLQVIRGPRDAELRREFPDPRAWPTKLDLPDILAQGIPQRGLRAEVNEWRMRNLPNLWRGLSRVLAARGLRVPHLYGQLWLTVLRGDGEVVDLGLASMRVVTTTGCRFVCDDFNAGASSADVSNMKYHGFGVGTTAEAASQTALVTELTNEYATDNVRPTGSQASATVGNDGTYTTAATLAPDSGGTLAVTEHGIFSQAATGGGTMLDRSKFAAVNLVAGTDSVIGTYVFTMASGS